MGWGGRQACFGLFGPTTAPQRRPIRTLIQRRSIVHPASALSCPPRRNSKSSTSPLIKNIRSCKDIRFPDLVYIFYSKFCLYLTWRHKRIYDIRTPESYALCAMLSLFLQLSYFDEFACIKYIYIRLWI